MAFQSFSDIEAAQKEFLATKIDAAVKAALEGGASEEALAQLKDEAAALHASAASLGQAGIDKNKVNPE